MISRQPTRDDVLSSCRDRVPIGGNLLDDSRVAEHDTLLQARGAGAVLKERGVVRVCFHDLGNRRQISGFADSQQLDRCAIQQSARPYRGGGGVVRENHARLSPGEQRGMIAPVFAGFLFGRWARHVSRDGTDHHRAEQGSVAVLTGRQKDHHDIASAGT